jgi:hypothetical protein
MGLQEYQLIPPKNSRFIFPGFQEISEAKLLK